MMVGLIRSVRHVLDAAQPSDALARDAVLGEVMQRLFASARTRPRVGRYALGERIGGGGQGVVYAAWDPWLRRRVAIKIVRAVSREATSRLRREATSLARLSHPNVIEVTDVGTCSSGVYIVMQYVPGRTLASWLEGRPTWKAALRTLGAAGRGLAAAHERGIVHRDFKPSNVWIGDDGVVRLLDFGLAQLGAGDEHRTPPSGESTSDGDLTVPGHVMGTPQYMAPEQHDGARVTPSSDQYAFCVALFEALYGTRPFEGGTLEELAQAKRSMRIASARTGRRVPARLRRIVTRGLQFSPADRWPSMTELLAALEPAGVGRFRHRSVAAGGIALGCAAFGAWITATAPAPPCASDDIEATWSPERRDGITAALTATEVPFAADTTARLLGTIDGYAGRWIASRERACEAAVASGLACLERAREQLADTLGLLEDADAAIAEHAFDLVGGLPDPDACGSDEPVSPDAAAVLVALGRARSLQAAGDPKAAVEIARAAVADARRIDDEGLHAEADALLGALVLDTGDHEGGATLLERAYLDATSARRDDVALGAALRLSEHYAGGRQDLEQCRRWEQRATAALERSDLANDGVEVGRLALARAKVAFSSGDLERALPHAEEAVERLEVAGDVRAVLATGTLAKILANLNRPEEAQRQARRGVEVAEMLRGPDHPTTASAVETLATFMAVANDPAAAMPLHERALAIYSRTYGPEDLRAVQVMRNTATTQSQLGDERAAAAGHRRVLEIQRRQLPEDDPSIAHTLYSLSTSLRALGERNEALAAAREAVRIGEANLGDRHATVAIYLHGLGDLLAREEPEVARPLLERGIAIMRDATGGRHPIVAAFETSLAVCDRASGRLEASREGLLRAIEIYEAAGAGFDTLELAQALHELAGVRAELGEPTAARADDQRALELLRARPGAPHPLLTEIANALAKGDGARVPSPRQGARG